MAKNTGGSPLKRFLEGYVLKSIGSLAPGEEMQLREMTPKLRSMLKRTGTWDEILAAEMQFPPDLAASIREIWEQNRKIAQDGGEVLRPDEFARLFVETNFA